MGEERTALELLRAWCAALEAGDVEGQIALLAGDAVLHAPYAPAGVPARVDGRSQIAPLLRMVGGMFSGYAFASLDLHATDAADLAFGTAHADITLAGGGAYDQDLVFLVRARDGLITEYTEYLDPIRAQAAMEAAA